MGPILMCENSGHLMHDQHPGITRMKLLARSYVWWPGIEQAIEKTVSPCYSLTKWVEVFMMKSISSIKTIERLRTLFATFGLHETLVSDNGTSFTSYEFKELLNKNRVRFVLTPLYHPASNGAAERCVQEVKTNLLRQVLGEHSEGPSSLQN